MEDKPRSPIAALIISKHPGGEPGADGSGEAPEDGSAQAEMEHCSNAMLDAIHRKDPKAFNSALHLWFQHAESIPHEEADADSPEANDTRSDNYK